MNRYTTFAATAALLLSLIAIVLSVITLARGQPHAGSSLIDPQSTGELFCIDGFAYHVRTTSSDSKYGGAKVLEIMEEPMGEANFDQSGREYPRQIGPKACSN